MPRACHCLSSLLHFLFALHSLVLRKMGQDISSQDRITFHALLCTVCRRVCGQSRILNDQNYFHHLADQWIKIEEGDSRFPLRESFPDPSQWNDSLLHIFEEEAPHHLSGAGWRLQQ